MFLCFFVAVFRQSQQPTHSSYMNKNITVVEEILNEKARLLFNFNLNVSIHTSGPMYII